MVHVVPVLGTFLATAALTLAKALSTPHLFSRDDVDISCAFPRHNPTQDFYRRGLEQYCHNYFLNGVQLKNGEELVVTMTLEDGVGCRIDWIYKMRWEDKKGADPVDISHSKCVEEFEKFLSDTTCPDGQIKIIMPGKHDVSIENKPGAILWVETRQRKYDKNPTQCRYD
ncbi:uncharacterized protein SETTUDRAFT_158042 [Exserohilum turcica Et28A]|uniref:Uncharacterized protein n=1 Tax=Exserohilum turcicum (strain 28A) TaxID=671987 RepID=R0I653_EXST2|nr:uncharacterized protein SETTUDRAFT_158042 [Exserohilum turcica Et28A]EOA81090.1 hypothetical protein SETTUDRAFT_158042 [Exserohilum turcica Et28A]